MYRLDPNPVFWETVKARRPGENAEVETFRAKFKALAVDEFNAHDLRTEEGVREFLLEVLQDVDDVEAPDGSPLTFTAAVRDTLIRTHHLRVALVSAYVGAFREALSGN